MKETDKMFGHQSSGLKERDEIFTAKMKMKVQMFTLLMRLSNGTADPINFPMQRSYRINSSTEGFT